MFPLLGQKPTIEEKKKMYDYKNYTYQRDDPYNPCIVYVCSFLIPGIGQMISGEVGREFAFLVPSVIAEVVFYDSKEKFDKENIISKKKNMPSRE